MLAFMGRRVAAQVKREVGVAEFPAHRPNGGPGGSSFLHSWAITYRSGPLGLQPNERPGALPALGNPIPCYLPRTQSRL